MQWTVWDEDDVDGDPRCDPLARACKEWFIGIWPADKDEPLVRICVGGRDGEHTAHHLADSLNDAKAFPPAV
jgi:hypothetical protein